jgi:hypothetical protein
VISDCIIRTIGPGDLLLVVSHLFTKDVKSAKEIECNQYKKNCCYFFLKSALCPVGFYLVIPNHVLGPCYACFGHVMGIKGV